MDSTILAIIILGILMIVASTVLSILSIGISIVSIVMTVKRTTQLENIARAFEKAFSCDLLGGDPHIDVFDYPMGSKMWMVPCRDKVADQTDVKKIGS